MNHQSFLDPILAAMPLQRPIVFLARDTLFKVPGLGRIMKGWSMISIKRGSAGTASLREAVRRMEEGYLVAIFPEGTRTADGSMSELKSGFLAMIKRTTVPVIPVGIAGAFQSFPRDAWIPRPARIRVVFGAPLDPLAIQAYRTNQPGPDVLALAQTAVRLCFDSAKSWLGEG